MELKTFQGQSYIEKTLLRIMNFVSDKYIFVESVLIEISYC